MKRSTMRIACRTCSGWRGERQRTRLALRCLPSWTGPLRRSSGNASCSLKTTSKTAKEDRRSSRVRGIPRLLEWKPRQALNPPQSLEPRTELSIVKPAQQIAVTRFPSGDSRFCVFRMHSEALLHSETHTALFSASSSAHNRAFALRTSAHCRGCRSTSPDECEGPAPNRTCTQPSAQLPAHQRRSNPEVPRSATLDVTPVARFRVPHRSQRGRVDRSLQGDTRHCVAADRRAQANRTHHGVLRK